MRPGGCCTDDLYLYELQNQLFSLRLPSAIFYGCDQAFVWKDFTEWRVIRFNEKGAEMKRIHYAESGWDIFKPKTL